MTGHRSAAASRGDRGSAAVEIVLITPALVALVLLVVFAGRAGTAVEQVRHAADQGARAASKVSIGAMPGAARQAALADLARNGVSCASPSVGVAVSAGGQADRSVTVTVRCAVNAAGMGAAAGSRAVSATSTEVIDRYRAD